jgi:RNA recognition motif-containing protein
LSFFEHPKPTLRRTPFFYEANSIRHFFNMPPWAKVNNIMSTKLYVGNLSFNTSTQDLETMFAAAGTVKSANIIEDRETGRSRGFAFVEMSTSDEAKAAITALDGKEIDGRNLKVNEAKAREERSNGGGGGYKGGGGRSGYGDGGGGRY